MNNGLWVTGGGRIAAVGVLGVALSVAASAQKTDAVVGVPVTTNAILQNADAYYGTVVTISAGVEAVLSKTAFVVDQRRAVRANEVKALGKPVLVIAPSLQGTVMPNKYVIVRGEIVKFAEESLVKAAAGYTLDLGPDVVQKYRGQPVLVADSVIDSMYAELAKPTPPPSKPAETAQ